MDIEEAKEYIKMIIRKQEIPDSAKALGYVYATEALETVLEELEHKTQLVNLMALAILNYDDQLVINRYKDLEHVKETFEEILKEEGEEYE